MSKCVQVVQANLPEEDLETRAGPRGRLPDAGPCEPAPSSRPSDIRTRDVAIASRSRLGANHTRVPYACRAILTGATPFEAFPSRIARTGSRTSVPDASSPLLPLLPLLTLPRTNPRKREETTAGPPTSRPSSMRESVASTGLTRSPLDAPLGLCALPAAGRPLANERVPGILTAPGASEEDSENREERVD